MYQMQSRNIILTYFYFAINNLKFVIVLEYFLIYFLCIRAERNKYIFIQLFNLRVLDSLSTFCRQLYRVLGFGERRY